MCPEIAVPCIPPRRGSNYFKLLRRHLRVCGFAGDCNSQVVLHATSRLRLFICRRACRKTERARRFQDLGAKNCKFEPVLRQLVGPPALRRRRLKRRGPRERCSAYPARTLSINRATSSDHANGDPVSLADSSVSTRASPIKATSVNLDHWLSDIVLASVIVDSLPAVGPGIFAIVIDDRITSNRQLIV